MKIRVLPLLFLCALRLSAVPAVFDSPRNVPVEGHLLGLREGHFNGDTHLDFVALSTEGIVMLPGNGDGTFGAIIESDLEAGEELEAADVDADGDLDLVLGYREGLTSITFETYRNNGSGSFTAFSAVSTTLDSNVAQSDFALGDVTGDGRADVVMCGARYFPGAGNGTFGAPVSLGTCTAAQRVTVFDANADGDRDILLSTATGSSLYRNDGGGTFVLAGVSARGPAVAAGDIDGNDQPDLTWLDETTGDRGILLASATGTYSTRTSGGFMPYGEFRDVVVRDLNGDGRGDVIAGGNGQVHVWITAADGSAATRSIWLASGSGSDLAAGDFDGDGNVDVLAGGLLPGFLIGEGPGSAVSLLRGTGGGALHAMRANLVSDGHHLNGVALSDITGDGELDIVGATAFDRLVVLAGAGDGTFAAPVTTPLTTTATAPPLIADYDSDGKADVVRLQDGNNWFEVWLSNDDGTFTSAGTVTTGTTGLAATGDFDGDGKGDLVRVAANRVYLRRGGGDGTFVVPVETAVPPGTSLFTLTLVTGDFNNDGRDDIAGDAFVLLGQTSGVFTRLMTSTFPVMAPALAADLNGDGELDMIRVENKNTAQGLLYVQLGNGDGTFGFGRSLHVYTQDAFGPGVAAADVDGDGNLDVILGTVVLLGDGAGWFDGYARFRTHAIGRLAVGDVDGNGSPDLVIGDQHNAANVILTKTVESQALPLTLVAEEIDAPSLVVGSTQLMAAEVLGETSFAAEGAVTFTLGGMVGAFAEPFDGDAETTMQMVPAGEVSLTIAYGGDALYAPAVGPEAIPLTVTKASVTSDVALQPAAPLTTDSVRLLGEILWTTSLDVAGTVTVTLDGAAQPSVGTQFDIDFGALPAGPHTVVLQYGGNENYLPHQRTVQFTVSKVTPSIALSTNPTSSANAGASVTLTATFASTPSITGVVRFQHGTTVIGESAIASGSASITTSALPVGVLQLTATYLGNEQYASVTSAQYAFTVNDTPIPSGPASLYLIAPCRVVDTRDPVSSHGGPQLGASVRSFATTGRCGIPSGAKAVAINVTAVAPADTGFVTLFGGASPLPATSTLNYRTAKTRANNAIIPLSAGGFMKVSNNGPSVHVIIDVTGYFQ